MSNCWLREPHSLRVTPPSMSSSKRKRQDVLFFPSLLTSEQLTLLGRRGGRTICQGINRRSFPPRGGIPVASVAREACARKIIRQGSPRIVNQDCNGVDKCSLGQCMQHTGMEISAILSSCNLLMKHIMILCIILKLTYTHKLAYEYFNSAELK